MNKKNLMLGISALALALVLVMTGCANEDKLVKDTPVEQRASLYLIGGDNRIEKIDGGNLGITGWVARFRPYNRKFFDGHIRGTKTENTPDNVISKSMEVTAGEHKLTISAPLVVGRKNFEGTFNFEAGKKYMIQVVPVSQYETMIRPNFDINELAKDFGKYMKDSLLGNNVIIIAESKRDKPRYPDFTTREVWIKGN